MTVFPLSLKEGLYHSRGRDAPGTRHMYADARMVAIACPEYGALTALQYDALLDYVHAGGTLVFIRPEGVLGAADTPLADILPVVPLGIRKIEAFPELDAQGAAFREQVGEPDDPPRVVFGTDREVPFLEGMPLWWTAAEGPFKVGFGVLILVLTRRTA